MRRIFFCLMIWLFLIPGCNPKDKNPPQQSYQEKVDELSSTYDQTFLTYLQIAEEAMGKKILSYSTISDKFTIPKRIDINGNHRDLGRLMGELARQQGTTPRRINDSQRDLNSQIIDMYREIYPQFLEMARGVGGVFGIPMTELDFISLEDGFYMALWYNLLRYPAFEALGPSPLSGTRNSGHCAMVSSFLGNTMLMGRNFDNDRERPHFVVYTQMEGSYKVMASAQYNIYHWVMDGINEKGLVMGTANQAFPSQYYSYFDPYPDHPVINEHHMFRVALETCATVEEVIALYQKVPPWCADHADHLMVTDALGNSAVIGLDTDRTPTFFPSTGDFQVLTNTAYHMGYNYMMNNCWRFRTATQMAEAGITSLKDIKEIMQAIRGGPHGYMSLYDVNQGLMRLLLRHDFDEPWDYTISISP